MLRALKRPTRRFPPCLACARHVARVGAPGRHASAADRAGLRISSLFGLAPCGVYHASAVTVGAVRSYRTFSPLPPSLASRRRYLLCGTCRLAALTPRSRTLSGTLPCGVRTFLSRLGFRRTGSGRPACLHLIYVSADCELQYGSAALCHEACPYSTSHWRAPRGGLDLERTNRPFCLNPSFDIKASSSGS